MKTKKRTPAGPGVLYAETADFCAAVSELFERFIGSPHPHMRADLGDLLIEVETLHRSWVGAKIIEAETGVKIPLHAKALSHLDVQQILARSGTPHPPCDICGEERITDYCHVLPRMMGGTSVPENIISLCPTHHFLFDSVRLSKEEWDKLDFSGKIPAAKAYAEKVVLGSLQRFWEHPLSWWQAKQAARYERRREKRMSHLEETRTKMRDVLSKTAVRERERAALREAQTLAQIDQLARGLLPTSEAEIRGREREGKGRP